VLFEAISEAAGAMFVVAKSWFTGGSEILGFGFISYAKVQPHMC
jgi:hypothetical protein